jgi:TRAP transporter TAXI family solute receptor
MLLLLALLAAGCARGPDEAGLVRDVQARLDALFGRPVLVLRGLHRQGSAPFTAATDGAKQAIVYYNATLRFAEPYDPSDWEGLSPQLIATALGATDEGLVGFGSGRMAPGSELRAYGSIVYRREGDVWRVADLQLPPQHAVRTPPGRAESSRANELIQRLAALGDTRPGLRGAQDEIVAEELDRALQNIQLRLDRGPDHIVVATGPAGGEYERFVDSIAARLADPDRLSAATTAGSVANAFLVDSGEARFGLVQSDVAAAAVTGDGIFATTGPLRHLSAVASLFPEPLHVIVRADAGIDAVARLAGQRISLGDAASGTRHTAVKVLAAHGLNPGSYAEADSEEPGDALRQLAAGTVDAVIVVVSAPWTQLSRAAGDGTFRLLPLDPEAVERIVAEVHGLIPLAIPARTYPGQEHPVRSVAATALLVTHRDTPDVIVTGALQSIFSTGDVPARGVTEARLSRERGRIGVTIPLHDGAATYFENEPPVR